MEKTALNIGKYNQEYLQAQIEKINHSLLTHQHQISKIDELNVQIQRHTKKIAELEQKLKLIETFQSQNFINNQRLFNSHGKLDSIEKKVMILEQAQFKIIDGRNFGEESLDNQLAEKLQNRIRQIQMQLQKSKQKNQTLVKFKRQLSPRLPNCQSTNDISIDQGNVKLQLKKIQKKLHESLMQKFVNFEKKYTETLQSKKHQRSLGYQTYTPNRFNRETRVKNRTNTNQSIQQENKIKAYQSTKNHFDSYYNEDTQKPNRLRKERKTSEHQNYSLKAKMKSKVKKQKSSSKSLSKQKSSKKLKQYQKKQIKLSSVNEYLRLHQKNK